MSKLFLGIDIGTSGCKLALFDELGVSQYSASEPYRSYYPAPGCIEQSPDDWWRAVRSGLSRLWEQGAQPSSISAIGIDGQSWSAIPVDAQGNVLARTPIWMDTRAAGICDTWSRRLTPERIFSVSGNPFSPTYTLPKVLYWMENEPSLIDQAAYIFQSNSFIVYRLTGETTMDLSMAYGWQNFDQKNLSFDIALSREFEIPDRFLIEPIPCDRVAGTVTPDAAKATGLISGTPVVAGGLDAACGTLGVGVIDAGQTQEQGGQAGGMSICLENALSHPKLILSAHVVPGRWLLQGGTVGGGASLKWFAKQLGAARTNKSALQRSGDELFSDLSAEAETSAPGANGLLCLPYFSGERSPLWDAKAQGMYFGLNFSTTHADLVRATMEGVAYALLHNIETAKEVGASIHELRGTGGSANSQIWTQIKADVTGIPMVIPASDTATACGAAMLAMISAGCYQDYPKAVEAIVRVKRRQEPRLENTNVYAKYYHIYKQLYPCTTGCMNQLYDIGAEN